MGAFNWAKGWTDLDELGFVATSDDDLNLDSEFLNVSTRGQVGPDAEEELNIGFIITGTIPQTVYLTGRGPSLAGAVSTTPLDDPMITLVFQVTQEVITTNSSWEDSPNQSLIQATNIQPGDANEAGIVETLPPGGYVLLVESESGAFGIAIGEVYKYE